MKNFMKFYEKVYELVLLWSSYRMLLQEKKRIFLCTKLENLDFIRIDFFGKKRIFFRKRNYYEIFPSGR
jgi:hypothetical protein